MSRIRSSTPTRLAATSLAATLVFGAACGGDDDGDTTDTTDGPDQSDGGGNPNLRLALELIAGGLDEPLLVTSPPDDPRLFVVEKPGTIKIIESGQVLDTPFLDIGNLLEWSMAPNEQGLLGLTFHPDYESTGRFFVFYIAKDSEAAGPGANVVAQFEVSADPNVADDQSELPILEVPDDRSNHNGGMIDFGPDGYLYVGLGDGGGGGDPDGNGQDRTTLLGSMLRIDVDGGNPYAIPEDNPYVGAKGETREEIWHYGLRNPWRWSFDRATGDLYIGDVGQNSMEEVNVVPAGEGGGKNFGWDHMEGTICDQGDCSSFTPPVATYPNPTKGSSVTGGYVYRGTDFPDLVGSYFYGDWGSRRVWRLVYTAGEPAIPIEVTDDLRSTDLLRGLSSFGQDASGEVYVVSLYGGEIYRIVVE